MPATYQGTILRSAGVPILDLEASRGHDRGDAAPAARHARATTTPSTSPPVPTTATWPPGSPATSWRSRCSGTPPRPSISPGDRGDARRSTASTRRRPQDFGRRCLLARRLVERGVRFVQLYSGGAHNDDNWDAHGDLVEQPQLPRRPHRQADRRPAQGPEAARPARRDPGRLGRRVRPPADRRVRQGDRPRPQRLRLHDVDGRRRHQGRHQRRRDRRARRRRRRRPASTSRTCTPPILHQLGLDPNRLTYFYGGLDQKLVGVEGAEPIEQIII